MGGMITPVRDAGPTISLLGRVSIGAAGGAAEATVPRGRRAELVFAYLAVEHRRLVTHDELGDALWPDGLPGTWEAALRGVLTDVRRFLTDAGLDAGDVLTTARGGHQLQLPAGVELDLDEAREALASARGALGADPVGAAIDASRAGTLAGLPFLPSHDGEWVDGVRRELETVRARALEIEARAHAAAGDATAAAAAAERLVQVDPFNEAAHQLRIRVHGQTGDRSGAIRAYEHCRAVLADELGVEPSAETTAAYREAVEPTAAPSGDPDLGRLSVLVVEDHDFQRRTAVMLLRNLGVGTVTDAADGVAALEVLDAIAPPDVILCDVDMPGMDGVEFIRHVAEGERAGAVILASALDAKVLHAVRAVGEGYGLQVLGAVEKPLTARRLGELLTSYRPRPRPGAGATDGAPLVGAAEATAALRDGRIAFHLQPVVDVGTGQVVAADALPWWDDPARGPVPPSLLLPVLAKEGLLVEVLERALAAACGHVVACAGAGIGLTVSVGLPADALADAELADRAAAAARAAGAEPSRLTFELDERAFRSAPAAALGVLTRLRVKGFGLSLGGFGVGHGPAEQLQGVPLTEVKLAAALVTGAATDPPRARALEDVIEAGRRLDVTIVGDGCDGEDDLRLLLALGCDRVQGACIAGAMPAADLPGWAAGWDPSRLVVGEGA